ncbi:hypothetical protein Hdeb2414_s0599g00922461 [Helianthus debilis subsp. tardiflorus]
MLLLQGTILRSSWICFFHMMTCTRADNLCICRTHQQQILCLPNASCTAIKSFLRHQESPSTKWRELIVIWQGCDTSEGFV